MEPKLAVVFLEAEEVKYHFGQWPASIALAVCLLPAGDHHFVILHENEKAAFPARLEDELSLAKSEILISPAAAGYQTREILFSEMHMIWGLVVEAKDALEEAIDYEANYRFAIEEGLDPFTFLSAQVPQGLEQREKEEVPDKIPAALAESPSSRAKAMFVSVRAQNTGAQAGAAQYDGRAVPAAALPSFLSKDNASPGPGFFRIQKSVEALHPQDRFLIRLDQKDGGKTDNGGTVHKRLVINTPEQVFVKTDLSGLAVRNHTSDQDLPDLLELDPRVVPENLRRKLQSGQAAASVSRSGWFFDVTFDADLSATSNAGGHVVANVPGRLGQQFGQVA